MVPPETQGDLLMAKGSYVDAIGAYQRIPAPSAVTLNKIGIAYHHLFAFEVARKYYVTALTINPRYPEALNNLAAVYHGEHNYKKAEKIYKKALKYSPDSALTYRNLGTAYFAEGKEKPGEQAYERALALDSRIFNNSQGQTIEESGSRQQRSAMSYYLAKTYAIAGDDKQAISYLRKALDEGFKDRRALMQDKEFARLRSTPEFQQFIVEQHLD
jgi:tetratricopeptide (TPR) repeat protein